MRKERERQLREQEQERRIAQEKALEREAAERQRFIALGMGMR